MDEENTLNNEFKLSLPVILGSTSRQRKKIFDTMGFEYTIMAPDIDEKAIRHSDPFTLTRMIASAKADALIARVNEKYPMGALLLTCDQVVVYNGTIREKPINEDECREFLRSYKSAPAECVCGIHVINTKTGKHIEGSDSAHQYFHEIPEHLISDLISQGDVLSSAGGFVIEHMKSVLKTHTGEIETIMGLPKTLSLKLLYDADIN